MTRYLTLKDETRRVAEVAALPPRRQGGVRLRGPQGESVEQVRVIKTPADRGLDALMATYGSTEALTQALIDGDPEIDPEQVGRRTGHADRIWLRPDGGALYSARRLEILEGPDGQEQDRREAITVEPTVERERALPWSGKLIGLDEAVRRFAMVRALQIRHASAASFQVLYDLAAHLEAEDRVLLVGGGDKGTDPLIFQRDGTPYRGFLQGRVKDGGYLLVLHLSNLEFKEVSAS